MTEPAAHAAHHSHVRAALKVVRAKHAALLEHHQQIAAAEVERRAAANAVERIGASREDEA